MKKTALIILSFIFLSNIYSQIDPLLSPYYQNGTYSVVMDSVMNSQPTDMLIFKPSTNIGGPFPTILFQPGANGAGSSYINKHSYDLYWSHLASYGYVIFVINNTSGGPNSTLFTTAHNWIKTNVNNSLSWMHNYVDLGRFVVAGHSNGGMNATDIIINRPSEIKAIIYMASYPNPGMFGFGAQNVTTYDGKVLLLNGSEDDTSVPLVGTTNSVSATAYQSKFNAVECKTRVLFNGVGHGGFGNYNNPDQPVGTIGREKATASIRHYIVSFLNSQFKYNQISYLNLSNIAVRPNSVGEFENTCSSVTNENELLFSNVNDFNLFPIPAKNNLNVSFNDNKTGSIFIYNCIGELLITNDVFDKTEITINLNNFTKGMYLINFKGNKGENITRKFVVSD
ncbi:MAG: T9SS type A sorting domain-containing protein [Bacteroidia bacterium]|nr:T9SS type A sorting domain-containing protein [Bacteroidia bacterium]